MPSHSVVVMDHFSTGHLREKEFIPQSSCTNWLLNYEPVKPAREEHMLSPEEAAMKNLDSCAHVGIH